MSPNGFSIAPRYRLRLTHYRLSPPGWPPGRPLLRIAAIADLHACWPHMSGPRIDEIVALTNSLRPDLIVLLGDYVAAVDKWWLGRAVPHESWARPLGALQAPLGVHAILGNHDWWTDGGGVWQSLEAHGIPVLENRAVRVTRKDGLAFWIAGLGDQWATILAKNAYEGRDNLAATLAAIPEDGEPVILLAHEPDIFPDVPARVSLTLSGHTHGGQVKLPVIGRTVVASRFGKRYAYGHVVEDDRHLIVSGGLGCTGIPLRIGVPPEIVLIELGGENR